MLSSNPAVRAVIKARQGVEYLANAEVRVIDDDGNEVAQDGTAMGEIIIRGNAVMKGYYDDPAATQKAIRDGWFHSGDAAVVHPDGYIEIRDRWKDIIISGGENISSVEVEGTCCCAILPSRKPPSSACRTKNGAKPRRHSSSSSPALKQRPKRSACSAVITSRTSKYRTASSSSPNCRKQRPARFRNTFCVADARTSPGSSRWSASMANVSAVALAKEEAYSPLCRDA
jgi:hypothetical protein